MSLKVKKIQSKNAKAKPEKGSNIVKELEIPLATNTTLNKVSK